MVHSPQAAHTHREAGPAVVGWRPVEEYDAMPLNKRPARAAFYFSAVVREHRPDAGLSPTVQISRVYGNRVCTHYLPLPDDPA